VALSDYQILKQRKTAKKLKTLAAGVYPVSIEWNQDEKQSIIKFSDGGQALGSCIHCINPPCLEYTENELELEIFKEFPSDKTTEVCPTKAISWPQESDSPIIDSEACISCGICVSRCPVAAIYLDPDETTATLNDLPNRYFLLQNQEVSETTQKFLLEMFLQVPESGIFISEDDDILQRFFDKFKSVVTEQKHSSQFSNHLVRNLMLEVGIKALMRRRGDTYLRMDIVFEQSGKKSGTCEVELGGEFLDTPRNLLDNVAVLVSRYKIGKDNIIPLVVTLSLPNRRSEYWQVIKDIKQVLDLQINSLTIGMLVLLVWNRIKISLDSQEVLYVDSDQYTLKDRFERILGRELNITEGYPGFIESQK
jgi:Fe-S-cluster-containing hydrogenase component 2